MPSREPAMTTSSASFVAFHHYNPPNTPRSNWRSIVGAPFGAFQRSAFRTCVRSRDTPPFSCLISVQLWPVGNYCWELLLCGMCNLPGCFQYAGEMIRTGEMRKLRHSARYSLGDVDVNTGNTPESNDFPRMLIG